MLFARAFATIVFATFFAAPAFAQQSNPQVCNAAINAVVAQRNQQADNAANEAAQLQLVSNDNESLKKQIADLQKQVAGLQKQKSEAAPTAPSGADGSSDSRTSEKH